MKTIKTKTIKMENTKKTNELGLDLLTHLFDQLSTETYSETSERVNSGKNRYRIRNSMKKWMINTSKILDNTPIENRLTTFITELNTINNN